MKIFPTMHLQHFFVFCIVCIVYIYVGKLFNKVNKVVHLVSELVTCVLRRL